MLINNEWVLLSGRNINCKKKNNNNQKSIACILAYYNGSKYIKDQLKSIINQQIKNTSLSIFISDDNSHEEFPCLKDLNFSSGNNINIFYRKLDKNIGYAKNFLYSLKSILNEFDFFCFSDQDDIWESDKIQHAIEWIKKNSSFSSLYFSRTAYFNEDCTKKIGISKLYRQKPSFKNALVQNMAGGNTMVFNNHAKKIICESIDNINFASHDWWCYLIISGSGGNIYYDLKPFIKYRQHKNNFLGSNNTAKDRIKRIIKLFQNQFKKWNNMNLYALSDKQYLLTQENLITLKKFLKLRNKNFLSRIILFYKSGIYRQSLSGNIGLFIALVFKKL